MPSIPCPRCRKKDNWLSGKFGPFCSQRCRLVDLGQWFNEEHKLSEPLSADHLLAYEDLENSPGLDQPEEGAGPA